MPLSDRNLVFRSIGEGRGLSPRHRVCRIEAHRAEPDDRHRFDGRIPFYAVPELGVVVVVEPEMVHAYFARDMFLQEWFMIVEKRHFPCRGEV